MGDFAGGFIDAEEISGFLKFPDFSQDCLHRLLRRYEYTGEKKVLGRAYLAINLELGDVKSRVGILGEELLSSLDALERV